jgi:hypothetical protein
MPRTFGCVGYRCPFEYARRRPMITAVLGRPGNCTRVEVLGILNGKVLVHAETAWHDTGWFGSAERWVEVADLHDVKISPNGVL